MAELQNLLYNRVPGMAAKYSVAGRPAETQSQLGVALQAVERIQQTVHIARFIKQSRNAVVDQLSYLSGATRHHRESNGHIFVNLERGEIKVRQFRIRRDCRVNRSEQRGNLVVRYRAHEGRSV